MGNQEGDRGEWSRIGWVLLVVACGAVVGGVLALVHPFSGSLPAPPHGGAVGSESLGRVAGVFSTIDLALLVALIVVYARTYADTRARFALGLVVFLLALTVQSATASLPVIGAFGVGPGGLGGFFLVSAVFESLALAIFLYLSIE